MSDLADRIARGGARVQSRVDRGLDTVAGIIERRANKAERLEDKAFSKKRTLNKEALDKALTEQRIEESQEGILTGKKRREAMDEDILTRKKQRGYMDSRETQQSQLFEEEISTSKKRREGIEEDILTARKKREYMDDQEDRQSQLFEEDMSLRKTQRTSAEIKNTKDRELFVMEKLEPAMRSAIKLNGAALGGDPKAAAHRDIVMNNLLQPSSRALLSTSPSFGFLSEMTPQEYDNATPEMKQQLFDTMQTMDKAADDEYKRRAERQAEATFEDARMKYKGKTQGEFEGQAAAMKDGFVVKGSNLTEAQVKAEARSKGSSLLQKVRTTDISNAQVDAIGLTESSFADYAHNEGADREYEATRGLLEAFQSKDGEVTFHDADGKEVTLYMEDNDSSRIKTMINVVRAMRIPEHSPYYRLMSLYYDDLEGVGSDLQPDETKPKEQLFKDAILNQAKLDQEAATNLKNTKVISGG